MIQNPEKGQGSLVKKQGFWRDLLYGEEQSAAPAAQRCTPASPHNPTPPYHPTDVSLPLAGNANSDVSYFVNLKICKFVNLKV